jgi:hypothetical protein
MIFNSICACAGAASIGEASAANTKNKQRKTRDESGIDPPFDVSFEMLPD